VPTFAGRGMSRGQRNGSPRPFNLCFLDLEPLLFYSSSSSVDLTRLSRPRSRYLNLVKFREKYQTRINVAFRSLAKST
jgi:hypothetical protein